MKRLNLGSGPDIKQGYVNMDRLSLPGVDVVHDLNTFPYPFNDGEFNEVYASHVLEHVDDLGLVLSELKRVMEPGGRIVVRVPHFSSGVSYRDPTHKRLFSYFTFDYFRDGEYGLPVFEIRSRKLNFTRQVFTSLNSIFNPLINLSPALYERFFCWVLPCSEVLAELKAV